MKNENIYAKEQIKSWANGVNYEVAFWNAFLSKKKCKDIQERLQSNEELVLAGCDVNRLIKFDENEKPIILDVGCALGYATGTKIDGRDTDFWYIDPLADFYNQILDKKKLSFPRIKAGMVEYLTGTVKKNSISLIIINNALDHSFDPIKGIIECFSTLKEGGILYLNHYKDEAEHENYRGFHQYNINCKNGQLLCWNKNNSVNISELLNGYAHVDITDLDDRVVAVIRKENDIEIEDFFPSEDDKRRFCIQIMYLISELLNWRITFTYSKNYFFLKIFHYISAKFSAEFKEKVKKLLKTK